jgi:lysyl-tRNA synthetase class 2
MLEFYEAYAVFEDLMDRTEELFKDIAIKIHGKYEIPYGENTIDMSKWVRICLHDSIEKIGNIPHDIIHDKTKIDLKLLENGIKMHSDEPLGKYQAKLFDLFVEPKLMQPTFVTHYPTDISPLARKNAENPLITDRFELFIGGKEIANGFSELNDPRDQKMRFEEQVAMKELDEEIPPEVDYDYVRALEYGMPPAAGEGIGIDRLVMLFTNSLSIRDVILFPLMKPHNQ